MAWIESHQSLSRHRKTLEAVAALHVDRHKFIGHLHELWWWGLDNANADGQLGNVPPRALANAAGWPARDAQRFTEALVDAGFVDHSEDGGYVLHDWFDYSGKLAATRVRNRERKAAARKSAGQAPEVRGTSAGNPGLQDSTGQDSTQQEDVAAAAAPARARGDGGFQPLGAFLSNGQRRRRQHGEDIPDEVRERLAQPPIGSHADG